MKINIWIRKNEAISGNITKYYNIAPQTTDWPNYIQVSISQDEFTKLEDNDKLSIHDLNDLSMRPSEDWLVNQYNRNRSKDEWVKSRSEIPYIFEKNPSTGEVYKRKFGDNHENREVVSMGVGERDYSGEKGLEQIRKEMRHITGGEFESWFHKLTKQEKSTLQQFFNNKK